MPTLAIDGTEVTVPEGTTILEAARSAGIELPALCWYPRLPNVGSCRVCLVSIQGLAQLAAACVTPAAEQMVVVTESAVAIESRRGVLAMLLERYPADEIPDGGFRNEFEQLVRRYAVPTTKRSALPLRRGDARHGDPLIQHAMSTCILCTRCVRACADLQVVGVLDVAQRGAHAEIVVGADGDPEHAGCTWCGECIRVCPTGAIHDILPLAKLTVAAMHQRERTVRSICPHCAVGCQLDLDVRGNDIVRVQSPWIEARTPNEGSTCVKGRFGIDGASHRSRLTRPMIGAGWVKRHGRWYREASDAHPRRDDSPDRLTRPGARPDALRVATWDEALEIVTQELARLRYAHGPDSVAVLASATSSNEENYLLQRLVRGAIGSNNIDYPNRLGDVASISAMQRAMNTSSASGSMREVEQEADVIFILGADATESHPVFGAAIKRAQRRGARLIVADSRRTELARRADIHLQVRPGTDVVLLNAMLAHLVATNLVAGAFIAGRTHGFEETAEQARRVPPETAAEITGVPAALIRQAAEMYARGPRSATLWSMGLTEHETASSIVSALLNLMLACGMIGRGGAVMLPLGSQSNAQGASDVGAIPTAYTDYQPVDDPRHRATFARAWRVPEERLSLRPGLRLSEMVRVGRSVRGMYVMGEGPAAPTGGATLAAECFYGLEFLAVHDLYLTETARLADVVLPGASCAEQTGSYVNSERRIQLAHKAVEPPGAARAGFAILRELTSRLGLATPFHNAADVMDEIARVTPSWHGVSHARLDDGGLQYPVLDEHHGGTDFLFDEHFPTTDGKATLVPVA